MFLRAVKFDVIADKDGIVELVPFGDIHIGNPNCDIQKVESVLSYVMEKPNRYLSLAGDLIENNIKSSPGSVFEQSMSITSQIGWICAKLQPIAEAGKIICYTPGNHEYDRSTKEVGISPADLIVSNLMQYDSTLGDRYCPEGAYIFLRFRNIKGRTKKTAREQVACFTIYQLHGSSSASRLGAKVNKVQDMENVVNANIYIHAHTHESFAIPTSVFTVLSQQYLIKEEEAWLVNCNSYLRYGGYASRKGMRPTGNKVPVIQLFVNVHSVNNKQVCDKIIDVSMRDF